jgi:Escherichia/Staphylococcus phage prohead protease
VLLHKQVDLDATITDQGRFEAIAATWSVDRQNEQILKGAFEDTITAWQHRGRPVPVHWDHKGEAANVIGSVDPRSMAETDEGLYVEGKLDLEDSEVAREAWRSMKAGRIALSFGYMVTADFKRDDGVRELLGIDLFEISLVAAPANPDTRIVSMKSSTTAPKWTEEDSQKLDRLYGSAAFLNAGRSISGTAATFSRGDRERMDREIEELAAELEAKAERQRKRDRPIKIKRFTV